MILFKEQEIVTYSGDILSAVFLGITGGVFLPHPEDNAIVKNIKAQISNIILFKNLSPL